MSERIQNVQPKEYNGIKYRSTLEADTAAVLDKLGIPFDYEKRKITLQEGFRSPFQKDKIRAITYTPDFEIGPIMLECKGFETPEWKLKKKLLLKYLMENEPDTIFYQVHDNRKSLLEALDNHLSYLGYAVQVIKKQKNAQPILFDSISHAMDELHLKGKPIGRIIRSLMSKSVWVYNYNWQLKKIHL